MTSTAKRLAWNVTIGVVLGGAGVACLLALGLLVAWLIEHQWSVPFVVAWVLAIIVAVGMAAAWDEE
ncbi:MAG: hypothetical protein KKC37_17005 [Proteobacteria bacterium]|nr:hypothetical protein [Pseudomonadota bacterium]